MAMNGIEAELRDRVDAFVADLTEVIRKAALETVREALGEPAPAPARSSAGKAVRKKASRKKAGRRGRRTAEDLKESGDALLAHVQSNPGQRLEEISAHLGSTSKELRRPVQLLIGEGKLRTEGQRRGTKYFAGSGTPRRKKASKRKAAGRKTGARKATRRKTTKKRG